MRLVREKRGYKCGCGEALLKYGMEPVDRGQDLVRKCEEEARQGVDLIVKKPE